MLLRFVNGVLRAITRAMAAPDRRANTYSTGGISQAKLASSLGSPLPS